MIRFTFQKLLHKKWMNFCTFLGMFLLIAVTSANTLYEGAASGHVLENCLDVYMGEQNKYAPRISITYPLEAENGQKVIKKAEDTAEDMKREVLTKTDCGLYEEVLSVAGESLHCIPQYKPDDSAQEYFFIPTFLRDMEEHTKILKGSFFKEEADGDGIYDCIINERLVASYNLSVGELLCFDTLDEAGKEPVMLRVSGIFKEEDVHDLFWVKAPNEYEKNIFISRTAMNELQEKKSAQGKNNVELRYELLFEESDLYEKNISVLREGTRALCKGDFSYGRAVVTSDLPDVLEEYEQKMAGVKTAIQTLVIPLYALLLAFLYMVSSQVFDMEADEIAMLKSRGVSRGQVVIIHFLQSLFLALAGMIPGIVMGIGLVKAIGSADAFMKFGARTDLRIVWDGRFFQTLIVTMVMAVLFMTLPAFKHAALSVVERKRKKTEGRKPFWQKYYLDLCITGISLYARYSLLGQQETISRQALKGETMDPLLFLSSVLFILGCGLLSLRLLKGLIKQIFRMGKNRWKPAFYVSFLQLTRSAHSLDFIRIFLILSIAMGIFYADTARTMNTSMEERTRYDNGADLVIREQWKNNLAYVKRYGGIVSYEEPDYMRYGELEERTDSMTRVVNEEGLKIIYDGKVLENNRLMAVSTKEFGNTAWMKEGALDRHWYHYLNDLGQDPYGVLVSSNFRDRYGAVVGDRIQYALLDELGSTRAVQTARIVGFVDMWPGHPVYKTVQNADGSVSYQDAYLIVANYSQVINTFGTTPYEIWIKTDQGSSFIRDFAEENGIELTKIKSTADDDIRNREDPVVQLTNGMLTISFITVMILCTAGFLIHWTLTIRKRELMLGIYRAMGMRMKEVIGMLLQEQFFASLLSLVTGAGVGVLTAYLYIPVVMTAYLPKRHALAVSVVTAGSDMVLVGAAGMGMLLVCFTVLFRVVKSMKIAQALKLGED